MAMMNKRYYLYLNGKFYGSGPLYYMHELIDQYGKPSVEFSIEAVRK